MTRSQHALVFVCLLALCSSTTRAGTVYFDQLYGFAKTTAQYGVGARQEGPLPLLADIYQPVDIGNGLWTSVSPNAAWMRSITQYR